jgi:hypothetical protein
VVVVVSWGTVLAVRADFGFAKMNLNRISRPNPTKTQPHRNDHQDHEESPITYNTQYQLLICREHGYALQNFKTHLRDEHSLSLTERKVIIAQHEQQPLTPASQLVHPLSVSSPVPGLKKAIKAYQCQHRSCTFIAASEDWIRQHANQKHGWKKSTELPRLWKSVRAQTFFTERKLTKYFVVEAGDCELNGEANSGSEAETTTENAP